MDSTPPRKGSKTLYTLTPTKNSKNNIDKIFNDNFIQHLYKKIPIIGYDNLLNLIIEYCEKKDKKFYLNNITRVLRSIYNLAPLGGFNNVSNKVFDKNGKFIKSYIIRAHGLIEGIIHTTLNYYNLNFITNINTLNKFNNNILGPRLYEVMNIVNGISLDEYIKNLFNSKITINEKKNILISILINISIKLQYLQNICGFIHGDLNEQNIFVNAETLDITFIDFGKSSIKLPIYTNYNLILFAPSDENLDFQYILDLNIFEQLKAIDLFYLIEKLSRFNRTAFSNFKEYLDIINFIKMNYKIKVNSSMELFEFVHSNKFFDNSEIIKLYPENFIRILESI